MVSATVSKPSVFVLTHEFFPRRGGIATFTEEIAKAAAALGYDLELWAPAAAGPEKDWPFTVRRLPLRGTHDYACRFRLARHLIQHRRRLRRAVVYLPEPGPMLTFMPLLWFRALHPGRLLLTFHGSEILRFARSQPERILARRLIDRAERISTLTHYTRDLLCTHFPGAATKTVITPGALRADFGVDRISRHGDHGDKVVILTVGRLHPRKGQLFILEALKALPVHVRQRIEYWLVGSARNRGYEDLLRDTAANSGLTVRFFGDLSDEQLDRVYDQADIFAMTSIHQGTSVEGFGLVYLEAAAHGLPVVAHAVGGVPEAVVHDFTGILVPPVNLPALTAAFQRLVADPELRRTFGDNGRDWARRNCWSRSAIALFGTRPGTPVAAAA